MADDGDQTITGIVVELLQGPAGSHVAMPRWVSIPRRGRGRPCPFAAAIGTVSWPTPAGERRRH
jgi:hypothetical protein